MDRFDAPLELECGKERLGSISKRGNQLLRTALIVGATSILKLARRSIRSHRAK